MLRVRTAVMAGLIGLAASAAAQTPPLEAWGELPFVRQAALSPDGNHVAALLDVEGTTLVLYRPVAGGEGRTLGAEVNVRSVSFASDDFLLLRASEAAELGPDSVYEYSAAFSLDLSTFESSQLLYRSRNLHPYQSGLGRMVGADAATGDLFMPAFTGERNRAELDLFRNPLGRSRASVHQRGTENTIDWFIAPDGTVLAREDFSEGRQVHSLIAFTGERATLFEQETDRPRRSFIGLTPDHDAIVYQGPGTWAGTFSELAALSLADGTSRPFLNTGGRSIDEVYLSRHREVLGVRLTGMRPDYVFADAALADGWDAIRAQLPDASVFIESWSEDRSRILFRAFDGQIAPAYLIYDQPSGGLAFLATTRPQIPDSAVAPVIRGSYAARDGLEIEFLATLPPGTAQLNDADVPAIILPHGGPASYDQFDFDYLGQFLASRGYLVLQPNFRGSSGRGASFAAAGEGEWGGKMQDDVSDGVAFLIENGAVDPARVCIMGASYGGYAALAGGAFTPELYRCVISVNGVSDLEDFITESRERFGRRHPATAYWEAHMGGDSLSRDQLRALSPARHAEAFVAPVLLIHGENDSIVPYSHSRNMERALDRADKPVELVRLDGEDHWLSRSATRIEMLRAVDAFLSQHNPVTAD